MYVQCVCGQRVLMLTGGVERMDVLCKSIFGRVERVRCGVERGIESVVERGVESVELGFERGIESVELGVDGGVEWVGRGNVTEGEKIPYVQVRLLVAVHHVRRRAEG